jgi:hypothetical protein
MADIKINDLTAYTDPVSTDVVPIVDVGSDLTKKVSIANLLENAGTGTATAPSFSFDGDNDTGIYQPGANQLAISTGGTQRLLISSNGTAEFAGNLEVGNKNTSSTTVAGAALGASGYLHVQRPDGDNGYLWRGYQGTTTTSFITGSGSAEFAGLLKAGTIRPLNADSAAAPGLAIYNDPDTGFFRASSNNLGITTAGVERVRINSTGLLVGGTLPSSPNIDLNSNGSATFAGDITCTDNSKGLVLKSPDGTSFRLSVANDGTLSATSI